MNEQRSQQLFAAARARIPGGVNSPVRACGNVGCAPLFIQSASGSHITDVDGNSYIDYVLSWGPMILGHAHPEVTRAIVEAARRGSSYGAPCPAELELAEAMCAAVPGLEMVRMVNSGTEATMSALRLARAVTGRDRVLKFIGCYHGHADAFLAAAGSGVATLAIPGTPGVPAAVVADTLLAPYNDLPAVQAIMQREGERVAAIIVEPAAANMGLVPPEPGFLPGLRELCDAHGSLLILDEVITGFRLAYGGARAYFGVEGDLAVYGKIIGGGLPVAAYGGKARYMRRVAPEGDVYQAGTLSGNPLAMAAGLATLRLLESCDYAALEARTAAFADALQAILRERGADAHVQRLGAMFCPWFTSAPVRNLAGAQASNTEHFGAFYRHMRAHGVYLAPSALETGMMSFAHSEADLEATLTAARSLNLP